MPHPFPHTIFDFPDNDGSLVVMTDMPKVEHVRHRRLGTFKMKHGGNRPVGGAKGISCGGHITFSQISDKKQVLFCQKCGLRFTIPQDIVNHGDLIDYPSRV